MPSKIQLDENLVFLYICLQKSDMKTIDFAAVGQTTNLKSPAARMRYTRLKRQIEKGVIGANANINLRSGGDERERNGEEKERRKEKREKKMREKKQKEEKREREGVEKKEKVEAKEWNRVDGGLGMEMGMELKMKMYDGVEKEEGKRKREVGDTTESDADAISEPDFQLQGWKTSILNNTTSPFPADLPPSIQFSTHPQTEHLPHPYLHNYPATSAPQPNISQSDFLASQSMSQTHPDQLPSQTSSPPLLDPQIKLEPYSPFSSFSSYSTERSIPNFHERTEDEDADSEDEMPLAKRRGLGKRHASRSHSQSQSQSPHGNGNENPNPDREEISHTNTSKIAEGYGDAHSHSHSHSCSEMSDLRESGCADEYTYTHPPLRSSIHAPITSSQYAYAYPNPYTTPYKSIYTPPASSYETLESLNSTLLAPLPSPPLISSSKSTSTPSNPPPHPHPYNWADTYQSYRHLWGTERIARVSPPPPPPPPSISTSSCPSSSSSSPLPLYHNHDHNHNYNHNPTHTHTHTPTPSHNHTHNHNKITNANTIPDSDFPAPLPTQSPRSNTHPLSFSQW
ncbi:uncharacterized protein EAE97_004859 [Botrytis byssoidea]|uniref:Myb-like DNA-binding domain-containing protein n=1 Tax=Botrytis byssoidea TaxID=139641 RepID=A0A9P5IQX9_9HELO|nr:uncharacterized protein EAE97_004859 [Botrytis byssoidea]KAF7945821.1 hypothetical protein EAE97_004859 [Botrytis byssoidea]